MATVTGTFDYDNPRYKCCCANCHSTTGVKVVAIIQLVALVFSALGSLSGQSGGATGAGGGGLNVVIALVCVGCAFYALHSGTAAFLIPYMVYLAIGVAAGIVAGLILMVVAVLIDSKVLQKAFEDFSGKTNQFELDTQESSNNGGAAAFKGVVFAIGLSLFVASAINVWLFLIFLAAYRFLREKALAGYTGGQQMVAMPTGQAYPAAQQYAPQGYAAPPPAYGGKEAPPGYGQPQAQPMYAKQ